MQQSLLRCSNMRRFFTSGRFKVVRPHSDPKDSQPEVLEGSSVAGKVRYLLDEVISPCLLAVLFGASASPEIALFGVELRHFGSFKDGAPT